MKKVKIVDIARELGMSRNTVAKVFNGGAVSPETRQAVVLKAKEMGYAKLEDALYEEVAATGLRRGTVLVLFDPVYSEFWQQVLCGVREEITANGYRMQLHIVEYEDRDASGCLREAAGDVKGIICLCVFPMPFVRGIAKKGVPITFFGAPRKYKEYLKFGDIVTFEGRSSVHELVSSVIRQGKKTFAFVGPAGTNREIYERWCGYADALEEANMNRREQVRMVEYAPDNFYSFHRIEQFINRLEKVPEVIVCTNDDIAKFVATALFNRNPALVKRTTIIGFDGTVEEGFLKQDILTVEVRKEAAGRRLVQTLMQRIAAPDMDFSMISLATYPQPLRAPKDKG